MYRLTYFNSTGRAEVIRLLMVLSGVTFQDNRIRQSDWPAIKTKMPWGQLPILEEDGNVLAQTVPILHYLGQKHGFGGDSAWDQALVSSVCEATNDLYTAMASIQYMQGGDEKNAAMRLFSSTVFERAMYYERFITKYGQNGNTVGTKVTTADLCIFNIFDQLSASGMMDFADEEQGQSDYVQVHEHPNLEAVVLMVKKIPRISDYLNVRTSTTSSN